MRTILRVSGAGAAKAPPAVDAAGPSGPSLSGASGPAGPSGVASRTVRDATLAPLLLATLFAATVVASGTGGRATRFAVAALMILAGAAAATGLRHDVVGLVSTYQRALEQGTRLREHAEVACRSRDELLRAVGHELRTPLNAILGWTALLHRCPNDPATVRRATETIDRSARAQARLVDELESFPRARPNGAGAARFSRRALDVRGPRPPS
jgi:signal transduction histidine kinase